MGIEGHIGRRRAMTLLGGSVMATAALGAAPAIAAKVRSRPARGVIDFTSQAGRAHAYISMRGALDERLVIGCVTGRYYGVVDSALTPLFGVTAATFARFRAMPDGGYRAATVEFAYFTDLTSGEAIERFANPYTGQSVAVPIVKSTPSTIVITPDLRMLLDKPVPGLDFDHHVLPVEIRGDDVWFTEVTRTSATPPGGKPFHYSESTTLHARRSDLEVPGVMRVACDTGFTNVVGWRPWLAMGDRPGHMMAIGAGRYGATLADLPPNWIAATRVHHPNLLGDPAAALEPLWSAK